MRRDATAHQRAGQVAVWLYQGSRLTTSEIARLTGLTWDGADYMMRMLVLALPITKTGPKWHWISESDSDGG